jgi:hypothetical protein
MTPGTHDACVARHRSNPAQRRRTDPKGIVVRHRTGCARPLTFKDSHEPPIARKTAALNLPLAARPRVGHIRLTGDVAEWLKAAVC